MPEHFLNLMDELMRRSLRMASAVEDVLLSTCDAVVRLDHTLARRIIARDEEIDREEVAIEAEALRLMTLFQPMGTDMRQLCTILKVNSDLERIADCAVNMAERACHLNDTFIDEVAAELERIYPAVRRMLHEAVQAYASSDERAARRVRSQDDIVDDFYGQFIRRLVGEAKGMTTPEMMAARLDILSIAKNLERIADHAVNIAEDVIYLATGQIVRHRPD